ncbi:MAG TPA: choice-of-anchor Q domain-containing protein [Candidatus Paceibacterota bacterium]|nr:choice-of-anchor Q domain-containing protein [Verrucomicrobiota bacterium]HSA12517.1 choice-of-anchor Q domain-containing protein [Candidatus Paceibacterota bacterium]
MSNQLRGYCAAVLLLGADIQAATWYVKTAGNDGADGTSWATAKRTIQAAVDATADGDTVLVGDGVYATGSRVTPEGTSSNRLVITRKILVKSVNGPEVTRIQGATGSAPLRCVYMSSGTLSGFMLTNGATPSTAAYPDNRGGGVYAKYNWNAVLTNCVITKCTATNGGGCCGGDLRGCKVISCQAQCGGGACGSWLTDCTLESNNALLSGGGAYLVDLERCLVRGNSSDGDGGGCSMGSCDDCVFYSNTAGRWGGGIAGGTAENCFFMLNGAPEGGGSCYSTLRNCTLVLNNASVTGGGSFQDTLQNCIVYYNNWMRNDDNHSGSTFTYSCTTPAAPGIGNIASDPQFEGVMLGLCKLMPASPCINRGDNSVLATLVDLAGNPRIKFGTVDMGAYEYQLPTGYWKWIEAVTNGLTNHTDCAAGDGYPNLLKYATGGSPTNSDHQARVTCGMTNNQFGIQFGRNKKAYDTTIVVEGTDSLTNTGSWQPVAVNFNGSWGLATNVTESGAGDVALVTVRDTAAVPKRFLRLRVAQP